MARGMHPDDVEVYRVTAVTEYPEGHYMAGRPFVATLGPFRTLGAARGVASREKRAYAHWADPPTVTTRIERGRIEWADI